MSEGDFSGSDAAWLRWYMWSGVDFFTREEAVSRYEVIEMKEGVVVESVGSGLVEEKARAGEDAARAAAGAGDLAELRAVLEGFEACELKKTAKNLVFADGDPGSRVMLIGEAPGRDEDERGLPFVGRSGQLLDKMLGSIGLDRKGVYITNTVFWRPPGNRPPSEKEKAQCRPFVMRHIELCDPKVIVLLGGVAVQEILGLTGITRLRGEWRELEVGGKVYSVLPTLHPAYLLRQPGQKALAWRDFLSLEDRLGQG